MPFRKSASHCRKPRTADSDHRTLLAHPPYPGSGLDLPEGLDDAMPPQLQRACSAQVRSPTTEVCPPSAFRTGGRCLCDPSHSGMGGAHLCHVDPLTETCRRGSGPTSLSAVGGIIICHMNCLWNPIPGPG